MSLLADGPELGAGIELGRVTGAARRWLVLAQVLDDDQVLGAGRAARDGRRFELGAVAESERSTMARGSTMAR